MCFSIEFDKLNGEGHIYVAYILSPTVSRTREEVLQITGDEVCPGDYEHIIYRQRCGYWGVTFCSGHMDHLFKEGYDYKYSKYEPYEVRLYRFDGKVDSYGDMASGSFTLLESVKFGPLETQPTPTSEPTTPKSTFKSSRTSELTEEPTPIDEPTASQTPITISTSKTTRGPWNEEDTIEYLAYVDQLTTEVETLVKAQNLDVICTKKARWESEGRGWSDKMYEKDFDNAVPQKIWNVEGFAWTLVSDCKDACEWWRKGDSFMAKNSLMAAQQDLDFLREERSQKPLPRQASKHLPKQTPTHTTPGFGVITAIAGIMVVAYIALKRRLNKF